MRLVKYFFLFLMLLLSRGASYAVVQAQSEITSVNHLQWADTKTERTWKERRLESKKQRLFKKWNRLQSSNQDDSRPDGISKWLVLAGILALAAILFEFLPVFSWFAGLFALGAVICFIVWIVKYIG